MNNGDKRSALDRRRFFQTISAVTLGGPFVNNLTFGQTADRPAAKIQDVQVTNRVTIVTDRGTKGSFAGSRAQDLGSLKSHLRQIRRLLIGKDPLDRSLDGEFGFGSCVESTKDVLRTIA
jgi:hypothetical protein